jgi:pyrroloquinoline quinone biosynthesis protein E
MIGPPFGLLAELTHRCPLHCGYCSNDPQGGPELTTADWERVLAEAGELGALHVHLSGGEPLLRPDLPALVAAARRAGLYVNLITSGIGLSEERAEALRRAGLDSVQLSFQADEAPTADAVAGAAAHARKLEAAARIRRFGWPLTLNVVLHRGNVGRVAAVADLAERLGAERLELANVQFVGWAARNREALLPGREEVLRAERDAAAAAARLRGRTEVVFVPSDHHGVRPKPCLHGWGRRFVTVSPRGDVMPCPTAGVIAGLRFENVRDRSLRWAWERSEAFERFRGTAWMREPCRSCPERERDFGGCRCQAALLTGDAANADPACALSPHHREVAGAAERASGLALRLLPTRRENPAREEKGACR